jgi:hypothetical protein
VGATVLVVGARGEEDLAERRQRDDRGEIH